MTFVKTIKIIQIFVLLFIFSRQENINTEKDEKYLFVLYPSKKNQTPSIFYGNNPNSEFLTINGTNENNMKIYKEATNDYIYKNISSVLLYENKYLIKTCFGPNKIMEIISQDDLDKKETQKIKNNYTSKNNFDIDKNLVFCYSSIIKNPDKNYQDEKAIITFYIEKNEINNSKNYFYK